MALSKHTDDGSSSPSDKNQEQFPSSPSDRSFSGNEERELLNDEPLQAGQEKYLADIANIEDVRGNGGEPVEENSSSLTDASGEEKDEEYINTDERKKDLRDNKGKQGNL